MKAVVFDFDGVIANSEPLHFRAFRDVLAGEGIPLAEAEYYERYLGFNDERAFAEIARAHGRHWEDEVVAGLIARKAVVTADLEREASILFPGARQVIERLAPHCPLAIASGALGSEIARTLEREQLARHFAVVVSADDGGASKPAPDPYVRAVERLSKATGAPLAPAECAAVEDSPWGLESARAAGLRTVAVMHTYPATTLVGADVVLSGLSELTWELLCRLDGPSRTGTSARDSGF